MAKKKVVAWPFVARIRSCRTSRPLRESILMDKIGWIRYVWEVAISAIDPVAKIDVRKLNPPKKTPGKILLQLKDGHDDICNAVG